MLLVCQAKLLVKLLGQNLIDPPVVSVVWSQRSVDDASLVLVALLHGVQLPLIQNFGWFSWWWWCEMPFLVGNAERWWLG